MRNYKLGDVSLGSWWTTFLDFFYPPKCPGCKVVVVENGAWCTSCQGKIVAVRFINMAEHNLVSLDSCLAICEYTGSLKRIIHDMKFRHQWRYSICLQWLVQKYSKREMFLLGDCVIPVPLHAQRLKERGYNQTEYIFKDLFLAREMPWMPELLERTRHTIPQWELKSMERKKNIKGAFVVKRPELVKNKNIILVDDIFTTGITLDECAKVLKKAGAISVRALVVASGAR